ncbi:Scavenger receptor class F member 2 [Myotis davidii]|uniref:Scavenger receptor class F member 2 n=1 Tax=Myotis davidii TaxID=225400 RepID=L5LK43_MYODS|nr:Scavenger receptor class F member 2 [Myotis davidii]
MCCAGWKQQGDECGIAVCEGNSTCSENEVCVRPGECRCRHGYFGANCDTSERWAVGLDPRELGVACERGGCDQPCATGFYGEGCSHRCPPCRDGHACNHVTGKCTRCNAGWIGDRCETKCSNGTYGEDCAFVCVDCGSGHCDFQSGRCLCSPGVHGPQELSLGRKKPPQRLCGRFSRISMKLPRIPLRRQKLPKVVVAHHDLDNTLNCSFLEPPSGLEQPSPSWSSRASFSSFDTTDEGPVYCVPHEVSSISPSPPSLDQ